MFKKYKLLYSIIIFMIFHCVFRKTDSTEAQSKALSRWKWEVWEDLPDENNFLKIYLFNITNPDEFEISGETPILKEIGPYVFREKRDKISITHNEEKSTASYKQLLTYEFVSDQSIGSNDDLITTINIPYLSFGKKLSEILFVGASHFKNLVKAGEKLIRRNEKVGDFLYYGIDAKPYLKVLEILSPGDTPEQFSEGRFGLFKGRNGSDEGELLVETGETIESSYGKIIQWKEKTKLELWDDNDNEYCNMINGTDGTGFDPKNMEKYDVKIFFPDVCRSLDYTYEGETMFNDILGLKYIFRKNMLEDPRKNSDNKCFCINPGEDLINCLKKGVMDISPCRDGAPLAISYPHFLDADDYYSQKVKGLSPNIDLHESYMIVEPKTGTVLEDKKRFQLNMVIKPAPSIPALKNLPDMIFPVMWSDKMYTLDSASIAELKEELKKHQTDDNMPSWHSKSGMGVKSESSEPKTNSVGRMTNITTTSGFILFSTLMIITTKYLFYTR